MAPPHPRKRTKPTPGKRPTMRDIAQLVGGVHPSTVSLALRNFPGVSVVLSKRIQAVAKRLGYRPDPLLAAFNSHRISTSEKRNTPIIALVADLNTREEWLADSLHQQLWQGARTAAQALHAKLELFLLGSGQMSDSRLNSILLARGISGLIVAPVGLERTKMDLDWENYSAVKIESAQLPQPLYQIAVDYRQAARRAWLKLRACGHQRIGLLCPDDWCVSGREFLLAGYALEQSHIAAHQRVPIYTLAQGNLTAVSTWLIHNRIDAVLSPLDEGLLVVRKAGRAIPSQISFASLKLVAGAGAIAGMRAEYGQLGALAVEQVVTLLRTNQRGAPLSESCTFVPAIWVDGATCLSL